jgi:hypothetical protein
MIIYRFRLTSEDHEDFLREIEIQPIQTFLDFHKAIETCANLENARMLSFIPQIINSKSSRNSHLRSRRNRSGNMMTISTRSLRKSMFLT